METRRMRHRRVNLVGPKPPQPPPPLLLVRWPAGWRRSMLSTTCGGDRWRRKRFIELSKVLRRMSPATPGTGWPTFIGRATGLQYFGEQHPQRYQAISAARAAARSHDRTGSKDGAGIPSLARNFLAPKRPTARDCRGPHSRDEVWKRAQSRPVAAHYNWDCLYYTEFKDLAKAGRCSRRGRSFR